MKTHKFIAALVADDVAVVPHQSMLWRAAAVAVLAAATAFFLLLYPRPDFMQAIRTVRFDFKFVVTLSLAASAFVSLRHGVRPEMGEKPLKATLLIVPALLSVAVVLELITVPSAYWVARWFGQNWLYCMAFIPALSLGPLAVLLIALRSGASTAPGRAGAFAGLLAGGIGAAFYAAHCPDDSPLFVASWYTIAIGIVTGLGALGGRRFLRW